MHDNLLQHADAAMMHAMCRSHHREVTISLSELQAGGGSGRWEPLGNAGRAWLVCAGHSAQVRCRRRGRAALPAQEPCQVR